MQDRATEGLEHVLSRSRWRTTLTETKKAAAISASDLPFSRNARKARN
jgi:hypothetical protein